MFVLQLSFIRGREAEVKAALLPFLRDRENIIQGMIEKVSLMVAP